MYSIALVSEIVDVIKLLSDVIKNTRTIVEAINDGRKFLSSRYPKAQEDFHDPIGQMQVTIEGLAEVTKVISSFQITRRPGESARS